MLVLDDPGREPAAEEVPVADMPAVEAGRVEAVQALHTRREPRLCRPEDEVEMIREERPGMNSPAKAKRDLAELPGPRDQVELVLGNPTALYSACGDVVERGGREGRARAPSHIQRT